jgi:beta-phosphoglucomutase-like phosphatase (HAD superfamily)
MSWGSLDSTQFWNRMKTEFHLQEDIETLISSYSKEGEMREYSKIGLMTGLVDLLDRLRECRILTAVATSGRQFRVNHVLDHFHIRCKFDGVFCNDDIQNPKPDPEIYLFAASKLSCSVNECLVIEDSYNGILSARSAGMTCFAHTRNKSNWENLDDADELFDSFDELVIEKDIETTS